MNPSALTALVDRWRPETHTFHLRAGEMAHTLQDVSMILGLPIQDEPLCMNTTSDGWRQQMEALIGRAPPLPAQPKERAPAGASFSWIRTNFGQCPEGANEDTLRTYTKVYLWYMISRTLFPDSGGKLAHWCWLKALTVLEHRWSWGTAALAYLYRQLDEACRRTGSRTGSGGIGGSMLLLSVWSWDRLSVGRPRVLNERSWPHHHENLDREPTWAYLWDNVSEMTSDPMREEIQKTAHECEIMWEQSGTDEKPVGPLRHFIKNTARKMRRLASLLGCREGEIATSSSSEEREIPEDELILSQSIPPKHTSKQAPRSAYQLKPRGKAPNRYTPEDYVNRGKKVVIEEDEGPPRRSSLSRMRNDEPFSSEEEEHEEQEEQQEQQQQEPRQRTKRMAVRKQPARTARRGQN
ncbi:hypothetical protein QYE76_009939 [Lolium multiflorum]|uniref:Aminotransferase-like plant mobile domain-containing protein n=1 Tax=Lolium multiflorum TaxID=4521 RepID=A0AAD8X3V9_LOLMU|nr:hypothetical protein QYE76_009939 [Lolium multiflorum]